MIGAPVYVDARAMLAKHDAAVEMLLVSPDTEQDLVTSLGHLVMRRRDLLPLLR